MVRSAIGGGWVCVEGASIGRDEDGGREQTGAHRKAVWVVAGW